MKRETEQRRFHRLLAEGSALLKLAGENHKVPVIDLSMKGALVGRPPGAGFAADTAVALDITLGTDGPRIAMEGRIAHAEPDALGICWEHIDLDSISELRRFVELNLGDAEVLNRELGQLFG